MSLEKTKIALIGSGCISETYLRNMTTRWNILDVVGCSDLIEERSAHRAEQFGIRQMTNEEILNDPEIKIVVNTTYPTAHYEVSKAALLAGKNVHCEKMLAVTLEEGEELIALAEQKGLKFGVAPDTFLGASHQTARRIIDSGWIGEPFMVQARVVRGYHPLMERMEDLSFVFKKGGGIPFDMGGYYLHDMIQLLGPVKRCGGFVQTRHPDRLCLNTKNPMYGKPLDICTPNALVGALEFENGVLGSIAFCSEGFGEYAGIEVYGTEGTLFVPDPNWFNGDVYLARKPSDEKFLVPYTHGYTAQCCRGLGVADMAWALHNGRDNRTSGRLGLHVFEIVHGIWRGAQEGKLHEMKHMCKQPAALPAGFTLPGEEERALDN